MTIRRRLLVSLLVILGLFAANQGIYVWSAHLRTQTMEVLDRSLTRQVILASLRQELDNLHKQVTLLSQVDLQGTGPGVDPEGRRLFEQKLAVVAAQIQRLKDLSDRSEEAAVNEVGETYSKLAQAWKGFYQYFGVEQGVAVAQLIVADPLSQHLLTKELPQLQEAESQHARAAHADFERVATLTGRITLGIFILSLVVAIVVGHLFSRHLIFELGELRLGAALIGGPMPEHRIALQERDELGDLAQAFNDMADNLSRARSELMEANQELERRHEEVEKQRQVAESLLLNILPAEVAEELRTKGEVEPRYFEDVTILFTDFVGFTLSTEKLAAEDLVHRLHDHFTAFDQIVARYGLEKLKTIGDSYMCVGGLPVRTPSHPVDTILAAFEIVRAVAERQRPDDPVHWAVRIGLHTGPVIAGVVGIKKFAFDIWGDSVNYASRMESSGAPNRINLSARTYMRVKDFLDCEYRGKVLTKEKKEFDMYFATGILPDLLDDVTQVPPPAFLRRYRAYFQKDPPAFPTFLLEPTRTSSRVVS